MSEQTVLIIGGTSGFGLAVAQQVIAQRQAVHIVGRTTTHVQRALATLNSRLAVGSAFDAQDSDQLRTFFQRAGKFDHVLSFLGGAMGGGFLDHSVAEIRQVVEEKFFANLQLAQVASRYLKLHGSLILTSGAGGHPYDASGAIIGNQAINTLVAGLAVELAPDYRINAVAPTWTPTGLWRELTPQQLKQQAANVSAGIPLRRVATVAEVASAYTYLMANQFVTGQVLNVDGGVTSV
ncbi:SDR family oxidoreductase [Lactiplantibacillus modestisalitolerans]|uniref:SDR family oxidoreductase n=1 Tax=Lactiplantibacillus modestisalitolerans TaxID=1457219 RepID=A0ABV5WTT8_9LACO|nr:SDR family oxidoreductase [Lactiplantibacillus modestisalitolerans]